MKIFVLIVGILFIVTALLDAFQTTILPRRATGRFRLTRIYYVLTWAPWIFFTRRIHNAKKRETALSFYGPLSLVSLLMLWAGVLVVGFGLIFNGLGSPFKDIENPADFRSDLYVSGTTLFTLGIGDVVPTTKWARELIVLESGTGLGFLAVVIGYFPVLYAAFSRREVSISLLDARAGSPPTATELLKRHAYDGGDAALFILFEEWERWSAELLESHISYPQLCYFRSQHTNQSWLSALVCVLDTCALMISTVQGTSARQAQLTFAMARHALVDLSQVFSQPPVTNMEDRLPDERFHQLHDLLCQSSVRVCRDEHSIERLRQMRALYEPYAAALSRYLSMPLPPWAPAQPRKDNWMAVAKLRQETEAVFADGKPQAEPVPSFNFTDEHHEF